MWRGRYMKLEGRSSVMTPSASPHSPSRPRHCPTSSTLTLLVGVMALPLSNGPWRRPLLSLAVAAALLTSATLLLLSPSLEVEAAPVAVPVRMRVADDAVSARTTATTASSATHAPAVRWRTPGSAAAAKTAAHPARPWAQQTARSAVEVPPLVVDRGEYGGGWGPPSPLYPQRQEVVIVEVSAP